jgi:NAD(P)H-nitrite reductase large subunit
MALSTESITTDQLVGHRPRVRDRKAARAHWIDDWDPEDVTAWEAGGQSIVGYTAPFMVLAQALRNQTVVTDPLSSLRPIGVTGSTEMADSAGVCSCHNVSCGTVRAAVSEGFDDVAGVKACTKAGTGCGSCVPLLQQLIDGELTKSGKTVVKQLCRHFAMSRPELFEAARATGIRTRCGVQQIRPARQGVGRWQYRRTRCRGGHRPPAPSTR